MLLPSTPQTSSEVLKVIVRVQYLYYMKYIGKCAFLVNLWLFYFMKEAIFCVEVSLTCIDEEKKLCQDLVNKYWVKRMYCEIYVRSFEVCYFKR